MGLAFQVKGYHGSARVGDLRGRAIFIHGSSMYRVVDSTGEGVDLRCPKHQRVVVNLKIGSLRCLDKNIMVDVYDTDDVINLYLVPGHELHRYLA